MCVGWVSFQKKSLTLSSCLSVHLSAWLPTCLPFCLPACLSCHMKNINLSRSWATNVRWWHCFISGCRSMATIFKRYSFILWTSVSCGEFSSFEIFSVNKRQTNLFLLVYRPPKHNVVLPLNSQPTFPWPSLYYWWLFIYVVNNSRQPHNSLIAE